MKRKSLLLSIIALMSAFMLVACGGTSNGGSGDAGGEKVLNLAIFYQVETLEPTTNWDSWYIVRMGVGETLVKFSQDMKATPWLAKSWSVSDDKLSWTFEIDENAKFSNGNKVDAAAVKSSLERVFELNAERATTEFFEYEEMTADGQNLTIKTKVPVSNLPGFLGDPLFTIVDTSVDTTKFATEGPIATGPYVVTGVEEFKVSLVPNENYWGADKPKLDQVNFIYVPDPATRALSVQSGEINMAPNMSTADLKTFVDNPDFEIEEISSLRTVMSYMNQNEGRALADDNLRKAIVTALDLETFANSQLEGQFYPGKGPLPSALGYGFDKLNNPYTYNLEKAKEYVAMAGYVDTDGDGIVEKDGKPLELGYNYYGTRAELPILAEATQFALGQIGIKVNLEEMDYPTWMERKGNGDFDLAIMNSITAGTGDPESHLNGYYKTGGFGNTGGYSNKELDAILDKLTQEFDSAEREKLVEQAQQIIIDDVAYIHYAYPKTNIVHHKNVTGVKMLPADFYWVTTDIDIQN